MYSYNVAKGDRKMERTMQPKKTAPKKKKGGGYDDMGNELPEVAGTLEDIDSALASAKKHRQEQERQREPEVRSCGCFG